MNELPLLVNAAWLASELGAPDLVVFETTKFLPDQHRDGYAEYLAAHIPGARYFDIDAIADRETDLPHMVPPPGHFARMVGALGVSNETRVVFYDQNGMMWAARGWWMFTLFGLRAAVLDGGLPAWQGAGHKVETGPAAPATPATLVPTWRPSRVRGIGDMLDNVQTRRELVLDARGAPRFAGNAPEPRQGVQPGHIPGSRNLPYASLFNDDGTLLPATNLRARFAAVGADGSRPVVTTCGSGVSASMLSYAMAVAGLNPAAVYDGSWTEWGGRLDTPKETGNA